MLRLIFGTVQKENIDEFLQLVIDKKYTLSKRTLLSLSCTPPNEALQDINFEVDREFSRRYLLLGTDEAAVRELFHEGCRNFFNSIDRNEIGGVEGGGHWLVFYQWNANYMSIKPEKYIRDIRRCLDNALKVYTTFQK
jgi:hypothetical protein